MQVTIDLVWSNITVIKNLKIHFATFVDGVLLKKKKTQQTKQPLSSWTILFV